MNSHWNALELQKKGSDSEDDFDEDDFENSLSNASPPKREVTSRRAATKVCTIS